MKMPVKPDHCQIFLFGCLFMGPRKHARAHSLTTLRGGPGGGGAWWSYTVRRIDWDRQLRRPTVNPYAPKTDQFQIFPAASPEILHHTVWRTWLFIAYSGERWLYTTNSCYLTYTSSLWKVGRMHLVFGLRSERVKPAGPAPPNRRLFETRHLILHTFHKAQSQWRKGEVLD